MFKLIGRKKEVFVILLLVITVVLFTGSTSLAAGLLDGINPNYNATGVSEIKTFGGQIVGIMQVAGYVVSAIMLVYIGIKWVVSSPEGKAEIKKTAIIFVAGAILIASAATVAGVAIKFGEKLGTESTGNSGGSNEYSKHNNIWDYQ